MENGFILARAVMFISQYFPVINRMWRLLQYLQNNFLSQLGYTASTAVPSPERAGREVVSGASDSTVLAAGSFNIGGVLDGTVVVENVLGKAAWED